MILQSRQIKAIMPYATTARIERYLPFLNDLMPQFNINNRLRVCHFLAQIAHESGELRYCEEIASGAAYDTGRLAAALGNTPEKDGDGQRYKGRGLIQLTGTANYRRFNDYLKRHFSNPEDVIAHPEKVAEPRYAVLVSCWYFMQASCNSAADRDDIKAVTRKVNGGLNGLKQRTIYLDRAKKVIL